MKPNKIQSSSILLIYTGGTIGMKNDPHTGVLVPFDFNDIYEEFPSLRMLGVDIQVMNFTPIDSSNVTASFWVTLADIIKDNYDAFDGFVILHGTDTMSYTSSALSFMLCNLAKPVIFTGSQIPIGVMRTDGRENLITALEIASAKDDSGTPLIPEVALYFQNRLFRANRTTKYSAEELDAFRSENYPALAEVGVNICYNEPYIAKIPCGELEVYPRLEPDIMVVKVFPGMTENLLCSMLSIEPVRGIVLETFGSGNAPTFDWFTRAIARTVERGIPVVNVTQCNNGSVSMELYETGIKLQQAGVISGKDMTTEAAVAKMMHLLANVPDPAERDRLLGIPLCGE
ncbi:MAG: asparaginase, partial [Alistipes sp.]|nr:asparaginase [Alistipes sp.]